MADTVVIEGTLTPCDELRRGERKTVAMSDRIERLVAGGFVTIVERHRDPDEPTAVVVEQTPEPAPEPADPEPVTGPPAGNARAEEWLAFLQSKNVDIPVDEHGNPPGREGLKAIWAQVSDGA